MELRLLRAGDESLAAEACRVFGTEGDLDPAAFLTRPETSLIVSVDDAGVNGWVYGHELVHPDGERTMLLYSLDVAERSRRHGIGSGLVTAFVDHARQRGCTEVWVLTESDNDPALATYAAAGGIRDDGTPVMFAWKLAEGRHS